MRRFFLAVCTAIGFLAVGAIAHGQAPQAPAAPERTAPPPTSKINLTLEQEHVIKEVVKDMKVDAAPSNAPETVGASISADSVKLQPMPALIVSKVPQIRTHRFFVKNDKIYIVDQDGQIAEVID